MKLSKIAAFVFAGAASMVQAQSAKDLMVFSAGEFKIMTFKSCYEPAELAAKLKINFGQEKVADVVGSLSGKPTTLYVNAATGSYKIMIDIPDERALNQMEPEQLRLLRKGEGPHFSCVMDSADTGYPDVVRQTPIYRQAFKP